MEKIKLVLLCLAVVFGVGVLRCDATTYMVGDTSGWDISTDLDTWGTDKTFSPGDVLVFQYSSMYSVCEVTKDNFNKCNATDAIQTFSSSGNTTVTLTKPGDRYFVSGNRLYCLAGMKLHVIVPGNDSSAPVGAPQAQPGHGKATATTQPSSKNGNPAVAVPSSGGLVRTGPMGVIGLVPMLFVLFYVLLSV